jgi:UDP-hydrolysing UDP-N-acetyl-D-glucosamine 2-epimerase
MKKKIIFVTTNRSEFGIIKNILYKFDNSKKFNSTLLVAGSHLIKKYGYSFAEIKKAQYKNISITRIYPKEIDIHKIYLNIFEKAYKLFLKKKPDLVFLTGDRFEILAIASVCLYLNIKVVHLHGGEITLGAIDDAVRHSISKIAKFHFVATQTYKNRLIQLGEDPKNIFLSGSPSVENILEQEFITLQNLEKKFNIKLKNYFILTIHPETIKNKDFDNNVENIFKVLKKYKKYKIIVTMPSLDVGTKIIQKIIQKYIDKKQFYFLKSLGSNNYISLVKHSLGAIGNSSSSLIELPSLKKGAINLGNRQNGRIRSKNVIDSNFKLSSINKALTKLLSNRFNLSLRNIKNPYYKKNSSNIIFKTILNFRDINNIKPFNNLVFSKNIQFKLINK